MHPFHEQRQQPQEPHQQQEQHSPQQQRKYSKTEIIDVLTVMLNNQHPMDTDATPSDEDEMHPFHEPPQQTPTAPPATTATPARKKRPILKQDILDALNADTDNTPSDEDELEPGELPHETPVTPPTTRTKHDILDALNAQTSDEEDDVQAHPPRRAPIESINKLKKTNSWLLRKTKRLEKTINDTKKTLSSRQKRTLEAIQKIRTIYYSNKAELDQAHRHMQYMNSIITLNQADRSKQKTRTPDELIDLYNPFADTNQ